MTHQTLKVNALKTLLNNEVEAVKSLPVPVAPPTPLVKQVITTRPQGTVKIAFLLGIVICLQALLSSRYARVFVAKYINNPYMATAITGVVFLAITVLVAWLFLKDRK